MVPRRLTQTAWMAGRMLFDMTERTIRFETHLLLSAAQRLHSRLSGTREPEHASRTEADEAGQGRSLPSDDVQRPWR